jgi:hypothetical protein
MVPRSLEIAQQVGPAVAACRWLERQRGCSAALAKEEQGHSTWTLHDDAGRHVRVGVIHVDMTVHRSLPVCAD